MSSFHDTSDIYYEPCAKTLDVFTFFCAGEKQKPLEKDAGENTIAWLDKLRNAKGSIPTSKIRLNMQRIMQNNAAVFRTQETLEEGMPGNSPLTTSNKKTRKGYVFFFPFTLYSGANLNIISCTIWVYSFHEKWIKLLKLNTYICDHVMLSQVVS